MSPSPPKAGAAPGAGEAAVATLLRDLGSRLQRAPTLESAAETQAHERLPTGRPELDRLLQGGLRIGHLSEISGRPSSGRTSVALGLLAGATAEGHVVAWIDTPQAFDAESAESAGVDLTRLLWVRPPGLREAIRCCDRVLRTPGFALVGLDLTRGREAATLPDATWQRLARAAAATRTALLLLSGERVSGGFADLALEVENRRAHFSEPPELLEGFELEVRVVRQRSGPAQRVASVRLRSSRAA